MPPDTFVPISPNEKLEMAPGASISPVRETARYKIGFWYVVGFLVILLYAMTLFAFKRLEEVGSLIDLLTAISGLLSGPLGFIIGFYFKSETGDKSSY